MKIRTPKQKDIPYLESLFQLTRQKTFEGRPKESFQIGDYKRSTVDDEVWVAEESSFIVGFISIYPPENFIHNLFIHPDYQKLGFGTNLLHKAESYLKHPMFLKIALDNLKASSFYIKHGWYQVSIHKDAEEPYALYRKN